MKFEFKGQTYEVDENNVIFSINKNGCIAGIEFGEPVKVKPKWRVIQTTRTGPGNADSKVLFESDSYTSCYDAFVLEKHRLVEKLMLTTDSGLKLEISNSSSPCGLMFIVTDINLGVEHYLRLTKG